LVTGLKVSAMYGNSALLCQIQNPILVWLTVTRGKYVFHSGIKLFLKAEEQEMKGNNDAFVGLDKFSMLQSFLAYYGNQFCWFLII
jgi:hypothetical protein